MIFCEICENQLIFAQKVKGSGVDPEFFKFGSINFYSDSVTNYKTNILTQNFSE
jgi:hypothetical protein